jgi:hypothetical protein
MAGEWADCWVDRWVVPKAEWRADKLAVLTVAQLAECWVDQMVDQKVDLRA